MTTFRKLPTTKPKTNTDPAKSAGLCVYSAARSFRQPNPT
jgi:hypothetical protein